MPLLGIVQHTERNFRSNDGTTAFGAPTALDHLNDCRSCISFTSQRSYFVSVTQFSESKVNARRDSARRNEQQHIFLETSGWEVGRCQGGCSEGEIDAGWIHGIALVFVYALAAL